MAQNKKLFSPNEFIILLVLFSGLILLTIILLNVSKKQDLVSKAYQPTGCNSNRDCPSGTFCKGGTCIIGAALVTQAPLAYVDVSTIVEKPRSIPAIYETPTPTPKENVLVVMTRSINGTVGGVVGFIGNFLESVALQIADIWSANDIDR